jgi:hypothetical protein
MITKKRRNSEKRKKKELEGLVSDYRLTLVEEGQQILPEDKS